MSPTIKPGEKVTVDYLAYARATPSRWDVIVFHPPSYPDDYWAMRVVGLPGENIVIRDDGLLIDGKAVSPPVHVQAIHYVPLATTNTTVPTNSYFVLGDNSTNANDSRYIGTIPVANILGKVKEK